MRRVCWSIHVSCQAQRLKSPASLGQPHFRVAVWCDFYESGVHSGNDSTWWFFAIVANLELHSKSNQKSKIYTIRDKIFFIHQCQTNLGLTWLFFQWYCFRWWIPDCRISFLLSTFREMLRFFTRLVLSIWRHRWLTWLALDRPVQSYILLTWLLSMSSFIFGISLARSTMPWCTG